MTVFNSKSTWSILCLLFAFVFISCSSNNDSNSSSNLKGTVEVDGSSTVGPVSEAVAEEFKKLHPKTNVLVGVSGSGGGFKRFIIGETDISNASRAMKDSESKKASLNGIKYNELRVGMDGLSVMVNPENTFVNCLTTAELKLIWEPGSNVKNWNQVRSSYPDQKIRLYGPGTDSGTFDFFTLEINGKGGASRDDYTASEDDNILIQGIFGDNFSLGYFGYAYYAANKDKLKIIGIDSEDGNGCIIPGAETIDSGEYPITRPLYIYVNKTSYDSKPAVKEFVRFYMQHAAELTAEVGYIPVKKEEYQANLDKLNK